MRKRTNTIIDAGQATFAAIRALEALPVEFRNTTPLWLCLARLRAIYRELRELLDLPGLTGGCSDKNEYQTEFSFDTPAGPGPDETGRRGVAGTPSTHS